MLSESEDLEDVADHGGSQKQLSIATPTVPTPTSPPMPINRTVPLLICSIGNPGSTYANTLHSAGHTVLNRLAEHLGYPKFHKDKILGGGLVSAKDDGQWTLWQSPSLMNVSGKGVRTAWMNWSRTLSEGEGKLVVIYDELEKALGTVSVKTNPGASAKGHNGLKSIMAAIAGTPFVRVGVGIGRPESRESDEVSRYVLRKMTGAEKAKIEGAIPDVIAKLQELERG